jgi:uncharacterized membrane protein YfcA
MLLIESLLLGGLVGLALGLTGAGGASLAVPLLVYVLAVDAPHAVAISLLAVMAAAMAGLWTRWQRREVDTQAGTLIAAGGIIGAPIGVWYGGRLPEPILLASFGLLVTIVSVRMWITAGRPSSPTAVCAALKRLSWRCRSVLTGAGLVTGLLSGVFGIGGGFVVVPAVLFATGTTMPRAVGTSLMVASIVSTVALVSMLAGGREVSWNIALPFLAGSMAGMAVGTALAPSVAAVRLQRGFAVTLGVVGLLVIIGSRAHF